MVSSSVGEELASPWLSEHVALNPGVSDLQLSSFEARYHVCLPQDLRNYFLRTNGMDVNAVGRDLVRFWSLEELRPLSKEAPQLVDRDDPAAGKSLFVFADYSIWAFAYAIRLGSVPEDNEVFVISGTSPDKIADSFSEFVDLYLAGKHF